MKTFNYEVIVVGGGHAGCEAALASARLGASTLLLTLNTEYIALTPCNPSMGGPGKGHLAAEIDALGGELCRNTEKSYVQVRTLNSSRGSAVQAWRAQIDKDLYRKNMRNVLENQLNLDIRQEEVSSIELSGNSVHGVLTMTGLLFTAECVILCTGTYLRSFIVTGPRRYAGGPHSQPASFPLGNWLFSSGFSLRRLQTATPCRVHKDSLDYNRFSELPGETPHPEISAFLRLPERQQLSSFLAFTNETTAQIIRNNLHTSPLMIGNIVNTGPRHCPSIDRKIINFPDKAVHQVFIEPEGYSSNEMYIQGATSATPPEVQLQILCSIPGFENVKVTRYGYGIEYDALEPSELSLTLESRKISGLFFAGQLNGTSGYEEAAAQGIIAGINAFRRLRKLPAFHLLRDEAYIGVMIDDLITKVLCEPYRMYTSRVEFRLKLRLDNATRRLSRTGHRAGLLKDEDYEKIREKWVNILQYSRRLKSFFIYPTAACNSLLQSMEMSPLRKPASGTEVLSRNDITREKAVKLGIPYTEDAAVYDLLRASAVYSGYQSRSNPELLRFHDLEKIRIPDKLDYQLIEGLGNEARLRLSEIRPSNLGQASRMQGVTPADTALLLRYLKKK